MSGSYSLIREMPEMKEEIGRLKASDAHFTKILERYETVNKEISQIESKIHPAGDEYLESLKKERLRFKDELMGMIGRKAHVS